MQAIILAGGLGTRLRALVEDRPKGMASFADKPFLEYQLAYLKKNHIDQIVLCVGYLSEKINAYFGNGGQWGLTIHYAMEDSLLGTGGAIKNAEPYVHSPFLVLNGDSFFDINLADMIKFHEQRKCATERFIGTMALVQVDDKRNFGSVNLNSDGRITSFKEKSNEHHASGLINAGIYLLEPKIFNLIPESKKVSLEKEIYPSILKEGYHLAGFKGDGFFVDIGSPDGFYKFQKYIMEKIK